MGKQEHAEQDVGTVQGASHEKEVAVPTVANLHDKAELYSKSTGTETNLEHTPQHFLNSDYSYSITTELQSPSYQHPSELGTSHRSGRLARRDLDTSILPSYIHQV